MKKVVEFPDSGAIKEEAAEWLIRLDGDEALTGEERRLLQEWLQRSQVHREQLNSMAELWGKMNVLTELAAPIGDRSGQSTRREWRPVWVGAIAIAVAAVAVLGVLRWSALDSHTSTNGLYATAIGDQQSVTLSDGSVVLLNTDSQIRVDFQELYRDVHLIKGEAHFTVAKDAKHRFRVFAGSGRIEAVGTAFSVYLKDRSVDVTVTEGRVALASESLAAPTGNGVAVTSGRSRVATRLTSLGELAAGQVATIETDVEDLMEPDEILSNLMSVTERDLSRRVAWTGGMIMFSGRTMEEAVREINRYTTVKIEFADSEVAKMRVGGSFPVGETEKMLESMETTFGLDVTYLSKTHVLVSAGNSN